MNTRPLHPAYGKLGLVSGHPICVDPTTYHGHAAGRPAFSPSRNRQPRTIRRLGRLARWHALRSAGSINWSEISVVAFALVLTVTSAIVVKELHARSGPSNRVRAAAAIETRSTDPAQFIEQFAGNSIAYEISAVDRGVVEGVEAGLIDPMPLTIAADALTLDPLALEPGRPLNPSLMLPGFDSLSFAPGSVSTEPQQPEWPIDTKWFNGRPIRPVRTMTMVVTAYSPDSRSCGDSADGITASLHDVQTNSGKLVAADKRVLPMGSMISVPGYDNGRIVPVLDVGGAIKGNRLDVLFPTHDQARKFGKRTVKVTIWGYADGAGKSDWRRTRDSR